MPDRYVASASGRVAENPKVEAFLQELAEVSRKHGLCIGHEDTHGAFIVHPLTEDRLNWLSEAFVDRQLV